MSIPGIHRVVRQVDVGHCITGSLGSRIGNCPKENSSMGGVRIFTGLHVVEVGNGWCE